MKEDSVFSERILKAFASVYISITDKCNLHCRHCSERGGTVLPDAYEEDVLNWIDQIAYSKCAKNISFVGGEPFLCIEKLRNYIACASKKGLMTTVITNGYWATTQENAESIIKSIPGLSCITVSSDRYHLEFIDKEIINNLVKACLKLKVMININITAASKEEGNEVKKIYEQFLKSNVQIIVSPMFYWGAATKLVIEKFKYLHSIGELRSYCEIRNHHIDSLGRVYACCGATLGNETNFLLLGNLKEESYDSIIKKRNCNPLFRFLDKSGPRGLAQLIYNSTYYDEFKDLEFTQDCELCRKLLNDKKMYQYLLEHKSCNDIL